ncbi:hypothetical protein LP417_23325 [Polaromonas sp. P1-6]|nr:hypothetical protein LP417_23325 [Polaromonas sp. P1-6]
MNMQKKQIVALVCFSAPLYLGEGIRIEYWKVQAGIACHGRVAELMSW